MARVKRGVVAHRRHKKKFLLALKVTTVLVHAFTA